MNFIFRAPKKSGLLLDNIKGAGAVYSLRKLIRTATRCMRVRRSNDNDELDIGFAGNLIDQAAIMAFVGSNSGFVSYWYDGTGNGRHLTAPQAGQPRIVNAGTYDADGIYFDGVGMYLNNNSPFMWASGSATSLLVMKANNTSNRYCLNEGRSTLNNPFYVVHRAPSSYPSRIGPMIRDDNANSLFAPTNTVDNVYQNAMKVYTHVDTGSNFKFYHNGASVMDENYSRTGNLTLDRFVLGALGRDTTGSFFLTSIKELIVFGRALTDSDRSKIEKSQAAFYGFTLA